MMKALAAALILILIACSLYAEEYHVSIAGLNENPGSVSKPFKTISVAAAIAQPGDTITVHEGVYQLDTDYFGKKRNKANPSAGPFENPETGDFRLKVWRGSQ